MKKTEFKNISEVWDEFSTTGKIGAYLLYRATQQRHETENKKD